MANNFPLILDQVSQKIKELPSGDNLDLTGNDINAVRNIFPETTETYDLGSAALKWRDLYLSGNSIFIGDGSISLINGEFTFIDENDSVITLSANGTLLTTVTANTITADEFIGGGSQITNVDAVTLGGNTAGDLQIYANTVADIFANGAYANAVLYVDAEISNLINSAPGVLDTLNELAAAINDDENFATTVANNINAAYSNAVSDATALAGNAYSNSVSYTDGEISSLYTNVTAYADSGDSTTYANAIAYADGVADDAFTNAVSEATVLANAAYSNAVLYVDAQLGDLINNAPAVLDTLNELAAALGDDDNFFVTVNNNINTAYSNAVAYADSVANDAFTNAVAYVDSQTTDTIEEGNTNLYFTQERAKDSLSATGDLVYDANTGEFSVTTYKSSDFDSDLATKTTNDLTEGNTNLYFTDQRAIDATQTTIDSFANDAFTNAVSEASSLANDAFTNAVSEATSLANAAFTNAVSEASSLADDAFTNAVSYADGLLAANDAMIFKGTLGSAGTFAALPTTHDVGWTIKVVEAGTYAGQVAEIGDMYVSLVSREGTDNQNTDWAVIQTNIDGAVTGPSSSSNGHVAIFDGVTGKVIADGGRTPYDSPDFDADLATKTTNDLIEGNTNLYYTDERVRDAVSANGDLVYDANTGQFSVTTYKSADFDSDLATKDTDNLTEGNTNLYFTDQRAIDATQATIESFANDAFSNSVSEAANLANDAFTNAVSEATSLANDAFTNAVAYVDAQTTDDVSEGNTNLYYTNERVRDAVSANGDLNYDANTGEFSVTTYKSSDFDSDLATKNTDELTEGNTNLYFIEAPIDGEQYVRVNADWVAVDIPPGYDSNNFVTDFAAQTSDDLTEGNTNLYFTESRARNSLSANDDLSYDANTGQFSVTTYKSTDFDTDFSGKNTDELTEGNTNLYYLDSRVDSHLSAANGLSYSLGSITADQDISSGANVTFTKVDGLATPTANTDAANKLYVDDLTEAAYSNAISYTDSEIAALVNTAPTVLDTLNELAAAINDDPDFANSVASQISTAYSNAVSEASALASNAYANAVAYTDAQTTDDVAEGNTNLYFTGERVRDAVSANGDLIYDSNTGEFSVTTYKSSDFDADLATKTTDDVAEGNTNLYFTDARVVNSIETQTVNSISVGVTTQQSNTVTTTSTTPTTLSQWSINEYGTSKAIITAVANNERQVSELLITHNTSNASATEYGVLTTNGVLFSVDCALVGNDMVIEVTSASTESTDYQIFEKLFSL